MNTIGDVLGSYDTAEILNLLNNDVVRRLRRDGVNVAIDSCDGQGERVVLPASAPLFYEPWSMDRGSILFKVELDGTQQVLKLATELDPIRFPDGSEHVIEAPTQRISRD